MKSDSSSPGLAPVRPGTDGLGVDRVELSTQARSLGRIADLPSNRRDQVENLRREIREGIYETADKLETALDRLMNDLE